MQNQYSKSTLFAANLILVGCSSFSATIVRIDGDAGANGGAAYSSSAAGTTSSGGVTSLATLASGGEMSRLTSGGNSSTGGSVTTLTTVAVSASIGGAFSGGTSATGGQTANAPSTGDATSAGGGNAGGGNDVSGSGGAPATGGFGGTKQIGGAGAVATGGSPASAGGSATAGGVTGGGGAAACSTPSQCDNGDPCDGIETCSGGKCVAGIAPCAVADPMTCAASCSPSGGTAVCTYTTSLTATKCAISGTCADTPISGFWDSANVAHIAYVNSNKIYMQALTNAGQIAAASVPYSLSTGANTLVSVEMLLAAFRESDGAVNLLWHDTESVNGTDNIASVRSAVTDLKGSSAESVALLLGQTNWDNLQLAAVSNGNWLMAAHQCSGSSGWLGESANMPSPTATFFEVASAMSSSDDCHARVAAIVGSTLMVTVSNFSIVRHSLTNLTAIGAPIIVSNNSPTGDLPAIGAISGNMALLWNETSSPGQLLRALLKEDGTYALSPTSSASPIVPKAVVSSPAGGALLVGTVYNASKYQVIGQRLDATLHAVGSPLPLDAAANTDATGVQIHASPDGKYVLLTYQQAGARFRIMGANFCLNP